MGELKKMWVEKDCIKGDQYVSKRGLFGEDQLGYYFPLGQSSQPPPATAFKQFIGKKYATRHTTRYKFDEISGEEGYWESEGDTVINMIDDLWC